jgi:hypothetical protein
MLLYHKCKVQYHPESASTPAGVPGHWSISSRLDSNSLYILWQNLFNDVHVTLANVFEMVGSSSEWSPPWFISLLYHPASIVAMTMHFCPGKWVNPGLLHHMYKRPRISSYLYCWAMGLLMRQMALSLLCYSTIGLKSCIHVQCIIHQTCDDPLCINSTIGLLIIWRYAYLVCDAFYSLLTSNLIFCLWPTMTFVILSPECANMSLSISSPVPLLFKIHLYALALVVLHSSLLNTGILQYESPCLTRPASGEL